MNKTFWIGLLFVLSCLCMASHAGTEFLWAKRAGGMGYDCSYAVAIDSESNTFITGIFTGSAEFGEPGDPDFIQLVACGWDNMFVAKLDANGRYLWARKAGGVNSDYSYDIAVDPVGSAYITGTFIGTADFGVPGEPGYTRLVSPWGTDIFIAKLDGDGHFLWARMAGGMACNGSKSIAVDAYGNAYITGYFLGTADFGEPGEPGYTQLISSGMDDVFVAKLDGNGAFLWARRAGGVDYEEGAAIAVATSGNTTITGLFTGAADFGEPGEPGYTQLVATGQKDIFIAGLDGNGHFLWARQAGGSDCEYSRDIALDTTGAAYVTGYFAGTADFGVPGEPGYNQLVSAGVDDVFVTKLDAAGHFLWARRAGGVEYAYGRGIAACATSGCLITGFFLGNAEFGEPGTPGYTQLDSAGYFDLFTARLDGDGHFVWALRAGGADYDNSCSIAAGPWGHYYITGNFEGATVLGGPDGSARIQLASHGGQDAYIAGYCDTTTVLVLDSFTASGQGHTVAVNWTTRDEPDLYGFWLYRLVGKKVSPYVSYAPVLLHDTIIPGCGAPGSGYAYSFTDQVKPGGRYFYILTAESNHGQSVDFKTRLQWR